MIEGAHAADDLTAFGKADIVALACAFLDPRWALDAARQLCVLFPYSLRHQAMAPQHWIARGPSFAEDE